jgi:hypothetical protein
MAREIIQKDDLPAPEVIKQSSQVLNPHNLLVFFAKKDKI